MMHCFKREPGNDGKNMHIVVLSQGLLSRIVGLIRRNFWFCDEKVKLTLYKTLVRTRLHGGGGPQVGEITDLVG